jgi:hypothetical protein
VVAAELPLPLERPELEEGWEKSGMVGLRVGKEVLWATLGVYDPDKKTFRGAESPVEIAELNMPLSVLDKMPSYDQVTYL